MSLVRRPLPAGSHSLTLPHCNSPTDFVRYLRFWGDLLPARDAMSGACLCHTQPTAVRGRPRRAVAVAGVRRACILDRSAKCSKNDRSEMAVIGEAPCAADLSRYRIH
eukprot:SAG25_NODE_179_length_12643_cov_55.630660_3_plen_108_part_00